MALYQHMIANNNNKKGGLSNKSEKYQQVREQRSSFFCDVTQRGSAVTDNTSVPKRR